ncbi:MAG: formylglycine-generating enzyme family protein [Gammaproteobacteria bacterium]|nr:formylglycine-generating enzyme family protein [Gammaproteobacteria bacterium]
MPLTSRLNRPLRLRVGAALTLLGLCMTAAGNLSAADSVAADIVTMRNGDIHNGTVVNKRLLLETRFGQVALPKALTARIEMIGADNAARITTRFGEIYQGVLTNSELMMARTLDTPLPLETAAIADIGIAPRKSRVKRFPSPDSVATVFGDLYSARVTSGEFMLKSEQGVQLIPRGDIHILDINASEDGDTARAQFLLNSGARLRGELMNRTIVVKDRYGNSLELPVGALSSIAFQVIHQRNAGPRYDYRSHLPQAAYLRDRLRDGSAGPELVALRGGVFRRGDLQGDGDSDEQPPQTVKLKPFAIGIYEVSFDEYDIFLQHSRHEHAEDEGWGRGHRPAINLSWESAKAYTEWLSQQTGERYRLPTDAEWEYAARGGTTTRFWWGEQVGSGNANCAECQSLWDGEKSSPVGSFAPNPFGLHDTAGNVFEWVADCWNDSFSNAAEDGSALEKTGCGVRVIRGGAWSFPAKEIRSANRWRDFQSRRSDDTGFRVVRELPGDMPDQLARPPQ